MTRLISKSCPGLGAAAVILAFVLAPGALAVTDVDEIPWDGAHELVTSSGIVNPEVLVGFNPQPDPPRSGDLSLLDPTTVQLMLPNQSTGQMFKFFFAVNMAGTELVVEDPEIPLSDFGSLVIKVKSNTEVSEGVFLLVDVFDVLLDFTTSSAGLVDLASLVGFNPQPDPPGEYDGAGSFAMQFTYTSLSDAFVTMRIRDVTGGFLELRPRDNAPEPGVLGLLGIGLLGIGGAALRRRRVLPRR